MLRVVERPPHDADAEPGTMWRWQEGETSDRECWVIVLPNGLTWTTTSNYQGKPWILTGQPPEITVRPSIYDHSAGREWHGWITNGHMIAV